MKGKYVLKVPNGKLVKIFMEYEGNKITKIKIAGDFFVYPEETIDELEKKLTGASFQSVSKTIDEFFESKKPATFGITVDSLKEAILNCRLV